MTAQNELKRHVRRAPWGEIVWREVPPEAPAEPTRTTSKPTSIDGVKVVHVDFREMFPKLSMQYNRPPEYDQEAPPDPLDVEALAARQQKSAWKRGR